MLKILEGAPMNPHFEKITSQINYSFNVNLYTVPYIETPWHYHPESEITFILQGAGTRIVGDSVEQFSSGDLVLSGPNLPHVWINEKKYFQKDSKEQVKVLVVHFKKDCFGKTFSNIPEVADIEKSLIKSQRGLKIKGSVRELIADDLIQLVSLKGFLRLMRFLEILHKISQSQEVEFLASECFLEKYPVVTDARMSSVIEYITQHFTEPITLSQISSIAGMTPNSFCRYFKTMTKKTFCGFLNELRIKYACKLLQADNISVTNAAFECGYNNLSHFNRQFKLTTGQTPRNFQRLRY